MSIVDPILPDERIEAMRDSKDWCPENSPSSISTLKYR